MYTRASVCKHCTTDLGYTEVKIIDEIPNNVKMLINGAYYLFSELT